LEFDLFGSQFIAASADRSTSVGFSAGAQAQNLTVPIVFDGASVLQPPLPMFVGSGDYDLIVRGNVSTQFTPFPSDGDFLVDITDHRYDGAITVIYTFVPSGGTAGVLAMAMGAGLTRRRR
jgi:hypothetical protein